MAESQVPFYNQNVFIIFSVSGIVTLSTWATASQPGLSLHLTGLTTKNKIKQTHVKLLEWVRSRELGVYQG